VKEFTRDLLIIALLPLWLLQLQGNLVPLLAYLPADPDLLALAVTFAALRLPATPATGLAFGCGLAADLASGTPLGSLALRDTVIVLALHRVRGNFFLESGWLFSCAAVSVYAAQQGVLALLLRGELGAGALALGLPRLSFCAVLTALISPVFATSAAALSAVLGFPAPTRQR